MVFNIGDQILWNNSTKVRLIKQYNQTTGDYLIGVPETEEHDSWVIPFDIKLFPTKFTFSEKVIATTRKTLGIVKGIQAFMGFNVQMIIQYHVLFDEDEYPYVYTEHELTKYVPVQTIAWSKLGISTDPKTLGYKFS